MNDIDTSWRDYAERTRQAMDLLGYTTVARCLPHEAAPCGGGYGLHAAAHLAVIKALADHQLEHLGMPEVADDVYELHREELAACPGCQLNKTGQSASGAPPG